MTYEMEYLMHLYGCGARGTVAEAPKKTIDWAELCRLSDEQSVTHTLTMALKNSPDIGCPAEIRASLMSSMLGTSVKKHIQITETLALLREMEQCGIHAVLMKGYDVARLYANPECRISADTDILISPDDEERAIAFFENHGFIVEPRAELMHHIRCRHLRLGLFEVHVNLWEEIVDEVMFCSTGFAHSNTQGHNLVKTPLGDYCSLGCSDAMMFLTLHMIKHFIVSGMSLRMMMDIAMYMRAFHTQIDTKQYKKTLQELRLDTLMDIVFNAMIEYCGFVHEDFPGSRECNQSDMLMVLDDLESGGWQGRNDEVKRQDGWYFFMKERQLAQKGKIRYFFEIRVKKLIDHLYAVFCPSSSHLRELYPWMKSSLFYPVAWLARLFSHGFVTLIKHQSAQSNQISDEGKQRIEMFRKLNM